MQKLSNSEDNSFFGCRSEENWRRGVTERGKRASSSKRELSLLRSFGQKSRFLDVWMSWRWWRSLEPCSRIVDHRLGCTNATDSRA